MARILRDEEAIRQWTEARGGAPVMMDVPEPGGGTSQLLQLTFGQHALNADHNEGADRPVPGFELAEWGDWIDALRRQDLVLVVDDDMDEGRQIDYRFMSSSEAQTLDLNGGD
ncbi:hypothetical protein [Pelagibacterium halotolerans]|uniref:hypothetical protein n=1 Tax=Pelagibacterium halotolerans TaxID=531813 RepID=UPI00385052D3